MRQAIAVDDGQQFGREHRPGELARGKIDADARAQVFREVLPVADVGAGDAQDFHAQAVDEVQGLGERDELGR